MMLNIQSPTSKDQSPHEGSIGLRVFQGEVHLPGGLNIYYGLGSVPPIENRSELTSHSMILMAIFICGELI